LYMLYLFSPLIGSAAPSNEGSHVSKIILVRLISACIFS